MGWVAPTFTVIIMTVLMGGVALAMILWFYFKHRSMLGNRKLFLGTWFGWQAEPKLVTWSSPSGRHPWLLTYHYHGQGEVMWQPLHITMIQTLSLSAGARLGAQWGWHKDGALMTPLGHCLAWNEQEQTPCLQSHDNAPTSQPLFLHSNGTLSLKDGSVVMPAVSADGEVKWGAVKEKAPNVHSLNIWSHWTEILHHFGHAKEMDKIRGSVGFGLWCPEAKSLLQTLDNGSVQLVPLATMLSQFPGQTHLSLWQVTYIPEKPHVPYLQCGHAMVFGAAPHLRLAEKKTVDDSTIYYHREKKCLARGDDDIFLEVQEGRLQEAHGGGTKFEWIRYL